jgi:hypothetical protein
MSLPLGLPLAAGVLLLGAGLGLGACAHGSGGEINVDEVQGQANQIERQLRTMRTALKERDVPRATEAFQQAERDLQEYRETLAAYPELGELKQSVAEAAQRLCYGTVDVALESCFQAVRAKDLGAARERLSAALAEHERCKPQIAGREDYMPLKLNLESAPQALAELERELARPGLQARVGERLGELRGRLGAVDKKLEALAAAPLKRELAVELDGELAALQKDLGEPWELSSEPEWVEPAAALQAELAARGARLAEQVRRGKLRWLIERDLPTAGEAARSGQTALKVLAKAKPGDPAREQAKQTAREKLGVARELYQTCQQTLAAVLKEEPGLGKTTWTLDAKRRSPGQIQVTCKAEAVRLEAALKRLERPPPPPPKPKKTGRRIQRW